MPNAYILNQVPTTYGQCVSLFAEMLVGAGWIYAASGDGLAAYNATGKVFTGTGTGAGGWNNSRAWARLQDPAARRELVIQHNASGSWRVKYSALAKFVGGAPSANTVPFATDERVMWGSGTDASPTFGAFFSSATLTGATKHYGYAGASAPHGFWWSVLSTPGGGQLNGFMLDPVQSVPEDPDPVVLHIGTTGAFGPVGFGKATGSSTLATSDFLAYGGTAQGVWGHMDVAMTNFGFVMPSQYAFGYVNAGGSNTTSGAWQIHSYGGFPANPFNGKHEALPMLWDRPLASLTNYGVKGWSTLCRWTATQRVSAVDTLANKNLIAMNAVWLPWDGVTTPTL